MFKCQVKLSGTKIEDRGLLLRNTNKLVCFTLQNAMFCFIDLLLGDLVLKNQTHLLIFGSRNLSISNSPN